MRLGISSYTYTWAIGVPGFNPPRAFTEFDLLERAAHARVGLVQIADNLPLERLTPEELRNLAGRARGMRIQIEVGTRGIDRDHLERFLSIAIVLGSPILRVVVDTHDHRPSAAEVVDSFKVFTPALERHGICLAIENHDRFTCRELADIVRRVDSASAGICLDTVNSFGALEGPEVVLDTLGPLVVNLHVKDFVIQRAHHMMGFLIEGRPAGQGRLNIPWLLEKLHGFGRDPNAILELWTAPEPTLEATIAKESEWAASSIEYLRQYVPG